MLTMKTNYKTSRTAEARETIIRIARYASKNMMRTKNKSEQYAKIIDACMRDINDYGIEQD